MSASMDFEFHKPERKILHPSDMNKWEKSEAYQDILGFLTAMNQSIKGKKISDSYVESDVCKSLCKLLDKFSIWVDEIKPEEQPQRYGNKAFKEFYVKLNTIGESELRDHLPSEYHPSLCEISTYLFESFGNSTRIDYGTGHELAFIMFLCCLHKIGALKQEDSSATALKIFVKYLDLSRKLQTTYKMEPAGSQGVWSLDDYQFIPFMWGSSQLMMNPKISPEMFMMEKTVEDYHNEYMFLACIKYILKVKTGPFAEHSNQLWNISAVQSWTKVNQGLFKMYRAEILSKFPIIQHVLFGSILTTEPAQKMQFLSSDLGHLKGLIRSGDTPRPSPPSSSKTNLEDIRSKLSMSPPMSTCSKEKVSKEDNLKCNVDSCTDSSKPATECDTSQP